jgi:hypothetical protein
MMAQMQDGEQAAKEEKNLDTEMPNAPGMASVGSWMW